jgi:hypothetical protein
MSKTNLRPSENTTRDRLKKAPAADYARPHGKQKIPELPFRRGMEVAGAVTSGPCTAR